MSPAELSQPQREAVVDLLLLGMYADELLAISEDERLAAVFQEIGWHDSASREEYIHTAIAKVRAAHESSEIPSFLSTLSARLGTRDARQCAFDLLESVLEADARVVDSEHTLHEQARAAFGI
jgi:hypothetical protein